MSSRHLGSHDVARALPSVGGLIPRVMGSEEAMIFTTMRNNVFGWAQREARSTRIGLGIPLLLPHM